MPRERIPLVGYGASIAALGDSEEVRVVIAALEARAASEPYRAPRVPGLAVRVIKSRPYGPYPGIRLIYRVEGDAIYLYDASRYDELSADGATES